MDHLGTVAVGVGAGLASGALNAVAFLISRHHATTSPGGGQRLLVLAHVVMAVVSLPLLWLLWPAGLLSALWLPPEGVAVNLVFGTLFNLPCVLLQRFNRWRLRRCLARMGA